MAEPVAFIRLLDAVSTFGAACANLTLRQLAILDTLCSAPGPHRVRHIAQALLLTKPVVTRAVSALAAHGFAQRVADEHDRRDVEIVATNLGRTFRRGIAEAASNSGDQ